MLVLLIVLLRLSSTMAHILNAVQGTAHIGVSRLLQLVTSQTVSSLRNRHQSRCGSCKTGLDFGVG